MPAAGLEGTYALVERAVGRKLRQAERAIDVLLLHGALERAKDELDAAIHAEMTRATRAWVRTPGAALRPRLELTPAIRRPLEELHELGREEALNELERLGYGFDERTERMLAAPDPTPGAGFDDLLGTTQRGLDGIAIRIADDIVAADLSAASSQAIAQALLAVPGARDLASRVVSTALYSGMGQTFEENEDLIDGWEYSAVLDGGTCDQCAPLDGTQYPSWDAIQEVLPDGGPNPECLGGGRCRCRAVPLATGPAVAPPEPEPEPEPERADEPEGLRDHLIVKGGTRGANVEHRREIDETLDLLETLIGLRGRRNLPLDGLPITMRRTTSARGHLKRRAERDADGNLSMAPIEINVSPDGSHPGITLAHEIGHLLDATYFAGPRMNLAMDVRADALPVEIAEAIEDFRTAFRSSRAYGSLEALSSDSLARYMRSAKEGFARAFSQWVAVKKGGKMRDDLDRDLAEQRRGKREGSRTYEEFWEEDDFAAIAQAVERLLSDAGLLR